MDLFKSKGFTLAEISLLKRQRDENIDRVLGLLCEVNHSNINKAIKLLLHVDTLQEQIIHLEDLSNQK